MTRAARGDKFSTGAVFPLRVEEEAVALSAGGVERALLEFRFARMDPWSSDFAGLFHQYAHDRTLAQLGIDIDAPEISPLARTGCCGGAAGPARTYERLRDPTNRPLMNIREAVAGQAPRCQTTAHVKEGVGSAFRAQTYNELSSHCSSGIRAHTEQGRS